MIILNWSGKLLFAQMTLENVVKATTSPSLHRTKYYMYWQIIYSCIMKSDRCSNAFLEYIRMPFYIPHRWDSLFLVFSLETSQVLWKQAEVHKSPEWLSSQSGSYQFPGGQILHPWCLRHDRCKYSLSSQKGKCWKNYLWVSVQV